MRALVYCRVSADPRGQGRSVSEQEAENRQVVADRGWELVEVVKDTESASRYARNQRAGWDKVVGLLASGTIDTLVTWEASRSTRDLEAYVQLREVCRNHNVLWCYNGRVFDLSRSDDSFQTGLDILLAEKEVEQYRERVLRSMRAGMAAGRPHGKLPYGYKRVYNPSNGMLEAQVIREDQAEIIREMARRLLAGEPSGRIASDLNARGVPAPRGGYWYIGQIKRILTNPTIIAKRTHNKQIIADATWPPILDEATFYQCAAIFNDPNRKTVRDGAVKHLLTGIMQCGVCGGKITLIDNRGVISYACKWKWCTSRRQSLVDDLITELILRRLELPDAAELFTRDDSEVQPKLQELAEKRARLDSFYAEAAAGGITAAALGRIEAQLLTEIQSLEKQVQRTSVPTVAFDLLQNPREVWKTLHITQKRLIVSLLLEIRLHKARYRGQRAFDPSKIEVTWLHEAPVEALPAGQE